MCPSASVSTKPCGDNREGTLFSWFHIHRARLAFVRSEHFMCHGSLMIPYPYIYIYTWIHTNMHLYLYTKMHDLVFEVHEKQKRKRIWSFILLKVDTWQEPQLTRDKSWHVTGAPVDTWQKLTRDRSPSHFCKFWIRLNSKCKSLIVFVRKSKVTYF